MNRRLGLILTGSLVGASLFTATAALAGPSTHREARQQARISQGIASGRLTTAEAARLEAEQARIEAERRAFWADGRLSPRERARLMRDQNRVSRHIYRLKHNGAHR